MGVQVLGLLTWAEVRRFGHTALRSVVLVALTCTHARGERDPGVNAGQSSGRWEMLQVRRVIPAAQVHLPTGPGNPG